MIELPKVLRTENESIAVSKLLVDNLGAHIRYGALLDSWFVDPAILLERMPKMELSIIGHYGGRTYFKSDRVVDIKSGSPVDIATDYLEDAFSFVIIDTLKTDTVKSTIKAWWPLLKPGGIMLGFWFNYRAISRAVFQAAGGREVYKLDCGNGIWAIEKE